MRIPVFEEKQDVAFADARIRRHASRHRSGNHTDSTYGNRFRADIRAESTTLFYDEIRFTGAGVSCYLTKRYYLLFFSYREATIHYECSQCGRAQRWEIEPTKTVIKPTCTEGGKTEYKASISWIKAYDVTNRSATKDAKLTDPLGHDWGEWTVETPASNDKAGVESRICARDETHKETREIPPLKTYDIKLSITGVRYGSAAGNKKKASAGEEVEVKITPKGAFSPTVTVRSTKNGAVLIRNLNLSAAENMFIGTFSMPACPVTVQIKFHRGGTHDRIENLEGAPVVSADIGDLIGEYLTQEELDNDFGLLIVSSPYSESGVPQADKDALMARAADLGATPGVWFDISLYKIKDVLEGDPPEMLKREGTEKLTSVSVPIGLKAEIPEDLQKEGRTFYLLTCHDGNASVAAQGTDTVFNWKNSEFSTYLIAYRDASSKIPEKDQTPSKSPRTGDTENTGLWAALLGGSLLMILLGVSVRKDRRRP